MPIDFTVVVADQRSATAVANTVQPVGYEPEISQDDETDEWVCYCTKTMLATYENVTRAQDELRRLAAPHGGVVDGWGTFGNVD